VADGNSLRGMPNGNYSLGRGSQRGDIGGFVDIIAIKERLYYWFNYAPEPR